MTFLLLLCLLETILIEETVWICPENLFALSHFTYVERLSTQTQSYSTKEESEEIISRWQKKEYKKYTIHCFKLNLCSWFTFLSSPVRPKYCFSKILNQKLFRFMYCSQVCLILVTIRFLSGLRNVIAPMSAWDSLHNPVFASQ